MFMHFHDTPIAISSMDLIMKMVRRFISIILYVHINM